MLISAQVTLPGITSDRVGARRPEIAEKAADLILGKTRLSAATLCRASQRNCARDEAAE